MKKLCLLVFLFATPLCAMQGSPLDKSLMALNEILNQLSMIMSGIDSKPVQIKQKQVDVLINEANENFSSVIADMFNDFSGEELESLFLPNVDQETFQYLADWQITKSNLAPLNDDFIITMINAANVLGMEKVIDVLSNEYARRQKVALYANPSAWWNSQKKILNDLPNELQVKLSDQLFPDINRILFEQTKVEVPNIKAGNFFFQPGKFVNLAVNLMKATEAGRRESAFEVGMLYKLNGEFVLQKIPKCYPCDLQKKIFDNNIGWSPNGEFLFIIQIDIEQSYQSKLILFHWNQSSHTWESVEKFPQLFGVGRSWSPDSKYIIVSHGKDFNKLELTFVYYDYVKIKQMVLDLVGFSTLAWSSDSKYCAIGSTDEDLIIQERDKDDQLDIIFRKKFNKIIRVLAWQPLSLTLIVGFNNGEIQLWRKNDNENQWELAQNLEPASKELPIKNYIIWSPDGQYIITYGKRFRKDLQEHIHIWQEEDNKWVIKKTFESQEKDIWVRSIYWNKNDKFIALFGPDAAGGTPTTSEIQLWQQENNTWKSSIIQLNKLILDWDVLYNADGSLRMLGGIDDSGAITLWNLSLLDKKFYFTLEQMVPLIDWSNKIKRGGKVPLPEQFKDFGKL